MVAGKRVARGEIHSWSIRRAVFLLKRPLSDRVDAGDRRMGMWSAISAAVIGVVYILVGLIGVVARLCWFSLKWREGALR